MPAFTRLGEIWLMVLIVIPLLYWHDKKHFYKYLLLFAGGLILTGIVGRFLKILIDRPRPLKEMAALIESHQIYVHVIGRSLRENSFPSGHTYSVFSGATFLSMLFKRWSPLFFSCALITGLSRIYVGAHFPLDVMGGMILGVGVTFVFCLLTDSYCFHLLIKPSASISNKGN